MLDVSPVSVDFPYRVYFRVCPIDAPMEGGIDTVVK